MLDLDPRYKTLRRAAEERRAELLTHELYASLGTLPALRVFMEHHVFAVWDFMSLLVRLQRDLTRTTLPWVPSGYPAEVQRFVNEIKLGEESDDVPGYGVTSHFDLYLAAMERAGASTAPARAMVAALQENSLVSVPELARSCGAPAGAARFLATTMRTVERGTIAEVAASFAFGREELIPDMFRAVLERHHECHLLDLYLRRHIEVDEGEHGPLAHRLVAALCSEEDDWLRAEQTVLSALQARHRLWSDTLDALRASTSA